ncbi:MAG: leucine-rich repeat domain-containing protein [Pseudoflavonifractor sp.]|nr:leucine-rich repeat domain-containing protein [Pseudoflavonifractor sp.]
MRNLIKTAFFCIAVTLCVFPCSGYDFCKDGVYYRIIDIADKDNPSCAVTPGNDVDGNWGIYEGNIVIPTTVDYNGRSISVVGIDEMAFMNSRNLVSVTVEAPVEVIPAYAFCNDESLERVTIPATVKALDGRCFQDCPSLREICLPPQLERLEAYAFYGCTGLTGIDIPDSVEKIAYGVFQGCTALQSANLPVKASAMASDSYYLQSAIFHGCTSLTSVRLPDGLTRIPGAIFRECVALKKISIPSAVTEIEVSAFMACGINAIDLPPGLVSIGEAAFYGTPLESLVIPDRVESIGRMAIYDMPQLKSLVIGSGVVSMCDLNIARCPDLKKVRFRDSDVALERIVEDYDKNGMFYESTAVEEVYVGRDGIPLYNLGELKKIEFGPCVRTLERFNLAEGGTFKMGSGIEKICSGALADFPIDEITIPASVVTIEDNSFGYAGYNSGFGDGWCSGSPIRAIRFEDGDAPLNMGNIRYKYGYDYSYMPLFYGCKLGKAYVGRDMDYSHYSPFRQSKSNTSGMPYPTKLTSLQFGDKVTVIGNGFARDCDYLRDLDLGGNVQRIGSYAFYGLAATRVTFPHSILAIGDYAFSQSKLTAVDISGDLSYIGDYAFSKSTDLKTVVLGGELENLCDNTFNGCTSLESVALGSKLSTIGESVFNLCDELSFVAVHNPVPPAVPVGTFSNRVKFNATLAVPAGSLDLYRTSDEWSDFWNIVELVPLNKVALSTTTCRIPLSYTDISLSDIGIKLDYTPVDATYPALRWESSDESALRVSDPMLPSFRTLKDNETVILTGRSLDGSGVEVAVEVVIGNGSGIREIYSDTIDIRLEAGILTVAGCDGQDVMIADMSGRIVLHDVSASTCGVRLITPGIYIVKVGDITRKILYR